MKQMKKENNENKTRISQAINYLFDSSFGLLLRLSYKFPFKMHLKVFGLSAPEVVTFVASILSQTDKTPLQCSSFPFKNISVYYEEYSIFINLIFMCFRRFCLLCNTFVMPNAGFYDHNNTYSCISSKHAVFEI